MAAEAAPETRGRPELLGFALVALSAAAFGTMAIFATYAYQGGASVLGLVVLRFCVAAAVLWAIVGLRRLEAWPPGVWRLWVLGGILYALQSVLFLTAVQQSSPALAALCLYVYPVVVVLLAALLRQGALTRLGVLGLVLAMAGLVLVLDLGQGGFRWSGALLALGAAAVYSVYILFGQRVIAEAEPIAGAAHVALSAFVTLGLFGLVGGGLDLVAMRPAAVLAGVAIGLIPGAIAIVSFLAGLRRIGAARASVLSMLEPVVTVLLSAVALGEALAPLQLLGGVLVVGGGLATMLPAARGEPAPPGA